jgi:hypothetical protein
MCLASIRKAYLRRIDFRLCLLEAHRRKSILLSGTVNACGFASFHAEYISSITLAFAANMNFISRGTFVLSVKSGQEKAKGFKWPIK